MGSGLPVGYKVLGLIRREVFGGLPFLGFYLEIVHIFVFFSLIKCWQNWVFEMVLWVCMV